MIFTNATLFYASLEITKIFKISFMWTLKSLSPSASLETIRGICCFQETRLWSNMSIPFSFQKPCCDGSAFLECSIMSVLKPESERALYQGFSNICLLRTESFPNQIPTVKYITILLLAKVTCKVLPRNTSRNLRINTLLT